jgi:membrane fusion protein (multidrug efflux system)
VLDPVERAERQVIEMQVEALPGRTFAGKVYALDPQAGVSDRAIAVRARVDNPDGLLKPGYFARINLAVARKENALLIPEGAVIPQGSDAFVFRITPEMTVTRIPVTLGERYSGKVEVTKGLSAGDRIVTSGQIKLREGAKVELAGTP